eukprot:scaffold1028_cov135-Cylindrotheca_fusiformis.AAC.3
MAVNKEKPLQKGDTVEEKVEALISSTINVSAADELEKEDPLDDEEEKAKKSARRSKRLAKKEKEASKTDKENSKKEGKRETKKKPSKEKATSDGSPSRKNKSVKSKKAKSDQVDQITDAEEKKEDLQRRSPRRSAVDAAKANAVFNLDDEGSLEPQPSVEASPTRSTQAAAASPNPPTIAKVTSWRSRSRATAPPPGSPVASSRQPSATTPTAPERSKQKLPTAGNSTQSNNSNPRASRISPPRARSPLSRSPGGSPHRASQPDASGMSSEDTSSDAKSSNQGMMSRLQPPKTRRQHESKLQNPGTSIRTGKKLSAIPSDAEASMSPLKSLSPVKMDEDGQKQSARSRGQSVGGSRATRSTRSSMMRKGSNVSSGSGKVSLGGNSSESSRSNAPFVHGGSEAESWAQQVGYLREDNTTEHELFCDQAGDELYEYDMRIRVIVRKRPLSTSELTRSGGIDVIHPLDYGEYGRVLVYQPKTRVDLTKEVETVPFSYDNVFDETSTNVQIYQRSLRSLIHPFFKGQWSTIFAYGQTGSGKTYTMMGSNMTGKNAGTAVEDTSNFGLYYLAALDIFDMLEKPEYSHLNLQVSLFEIYGGKLYDLLNGRSPIKCLEDSKGKVCFPGLTEHPVEDPDRVMQLIEEGAANRSTGTTSRNADSSRSHAVLQLKLRKDVGRRTNVEHGRLNFIDLAGSERGADTSNCSRATRLEGAEINTSLLALKEVIRALATGGSMTHIPFRGSKLTQVLKDSFVGENSRCCMVACISPDIGNCEQTLNTLRYADRVKERDPDSGTLPASCDQPVRLNPIPAQPIPLEYDADDVQDSACMDDDDENYQNEVTMLVNQSMQSTDTRVLDDLLATPLQPPRQVPRPDADPMKQRAGQDLITAHRSIMSSMLTMVKNEMTLVNTVDGDREGLDDYISELQILQSTQLDLISKLRGALSTYVTVAEGSPEEGFNDDDSFEDLRD